LAEITAALDLIAAAPLFAGLDRADIAAIAEHCRERRYPKGEMLFARGDPGERIFVVREGQIRLAVATAEGKELNFQVAGPGDMFGEIAVLDGRPRSAEAVALTSAVCLTLERRDFQSLRADRPAITDAVVAYLCRRLREVSDKLEAIALYPLETRVARFLFAALRGREAGRGRMPLELPYSQSELAALLGASRQKINAALGALEDANAIKRTSDRLFCDREILARIAGLGEES
jgi:CRP/FNR family transcriptional regulator, cyclic AMP receptor protein